MVHITESSKYLTVHTWVEYDQKPAVTLTITTVPAIPNRTSVSIAWGGSETLNMAKVELVAKALRAAVKLAKESLA